MTTLIQNGIIVDGSDRKAFQADIVLQDDHIQDIGQCSKHFRHFDRIIDAHNAYVAPGFIDLVIFDKDFQDRATFDNSAVYPEGLKYVIIHGEIKVENGKYRDNRAGRVIRSDAGC